MVSNNQNHSQEQLEPWTANPKDNQVYISWYNGLDHGLLTSPGPFEPTHLAVLLAAPQCRTSLFQNPVNRTNKMLPQNRTQAPSQQHVKNSRCTMLEQRSSCKRTRVKPMNIIQRQYIPIRVQSIDCHIVTPLFVL